MTDTTVKNNETTQKESDESTSKGDIKHIGYAGLIARRFFRQRSAVVGLIILLVLVFCLLYTPCIAAVASVKRELGGKWAFIMVANQCIVAWLAAFGTRLIMML